MLRVLAVAILLIIGFALAEPASARPHPPGPKHGRPVSAATQVRSARAEARAAEAKGHRTAAHARAEAKAARAAAHAAAARAGARAKAAIRSHARTRHSSRPQAHPKIKAPTKPGLPKPRSTRTSAAIKRDATTAPTAPAATRRLAATDAGTAGNQPPGIGLNVNVGIVHIGVNLPLSLPALLGGAKPTTATPSTPSAPSTSTAARTPSNSGRPSSSARPYPPTLPSSTGAAAGGGAAAAGPIRNANPAAPRSSASRPAHPSSAPSGSPTAARSTHRSQPGLVSVTRLVPASGAVIFLVLCAACAVGVALVVRASGGRRRL